MAQRTRRRVVLYGGYQMGRYTTPVGTTTQYETSYPCNHTCLDETHPGPPYRSGGPLTITKKSVNVGRTVSFDSNLYSFPYRYTGHMMCVPYVPTDPIARSLSGWGAKGWNRTYPLHPISQLGVSLIELKDVPNMLKQTWRFFSGIRKLALSNKPTTVGRFLHDFKKGPSYIAGHYLNLQFGWVPFIQDLLFITQMKDKLDRKLAWLKKHNGGHVKRSVELDQQSYSLDIPRSMAHLSGFRPVLATQLYGADATKTYSNPARVDYTSRIWYEAKYRMLIPELLGKPWADGYNRLEHQLLGLALDPVILYKVIPYSWLLDWFTSVGAVVQNISMRAQSHIVADYAYVMCTEKYTFTSKADCNVKTGDFNSVTAALAPEIHLSSSSAVEFEFKRREVANPYGFGITFSSLSGYQWSILSALGLTRLR